jgi:hypothetical protein
MAIRKQEHPGYPAEPRPFPTPPAAAKPKTPAPKPVALPRHRDPRDRAA